MSVPILVPAAIAKIIKKINNRIPAPIMKFFVFFMVFTTFPFCFGGSLPLPAPRKELASLHAVFSNEPKLHSRKELFVSIVHIQYIQYIIFISPCQPLFRKKSKEFLQKGGWGTVSL